MTRVYIPRARSEWNGGIGLPLRYGVFDEEEVVMEFAGEVGEPFKKADIRYRTVEVKKQWNGDLHEAADDGSEEEQSESSNEEHSDDSEQSSGEEDEDSE